MAYTNINVYVVNFFSYISKGTLYAYLLARRFTISCVASLIHKPSNKVTNPIVLSIIYLSRLLESNFHQ